MNVLPGKSADIIKVITGRWPLLGLFLLIVEGLLGYWLHKAQDEGERIVAGVLMTLLLCGVLYVVVVVARLELGSKQRMPSGPSKDVKGIQEASKKEIDSPPPESISSPDGSYIIDKPPEDW